MATNAKAGAARQLASARTATAVWKKYTVQSNGIWDRIRRALAIDENRSTGIPLNPQYRNPPPGANPPEAYDDPVTVPSGDIAENPYYKRDIRRSYPRLSVVKQADVVGLLSVGSKTNPKEDVLQIGDAGAKQLVHVKQEGEDKGLAAYFQKEKSATKGIFGPDGLPPFPSGMSRTSPVGGRKYVMDADREQGYPEDIYEEDDQNNGLRNGDDLHDGRVTKLWLTECAHLTCAKHLEGGGVPFHSNQQTPRAPCPLCTAEKNDRSEKDLFYINGDSKGEYDSSIPDAYFQIPPVDLGGGSDPGTNALLFQYVSLLRFGTKTYEKARRLGNALQRWEDKKSDIVRSLSSVAPLRNELFSAGRKLITFGHDVSLIEAALNLAGASLTQQLHHQQQPGTRQHHQENVRADDNSNNFRNLDAGSRLARGSVADLTLLNKETGNLHSPRHEFRPDLVTQDAPSAKRKRVHSFGDLDKVANVPGARPHGKVQSRDLMPPPPIPMQQPYVFMARVHNPDVDGSTSETDRSDNERLQVPHTTPQRQTSGSFFTEQFGYPSMNFTPIPPTRPLPQIRPSSRRNWSRISGHDNLHGPNGPVNPLPNRLQLQAHPDHVNNLLPRQGGHRRAQTASSETLPVFLNQTLGVSPNPAMNPPFHLPQAPSRVGNMNGPYPSRGGGTGGLGSASSETLVPSNSSLGLSGNARTSSSRQTFLGSESNTFVGHHLSRLERPDPAASPHFPTSDQPRGASLPPGLLSPRRHQEGFIRRTNSYETGSSPVNSEMRSFSDTAGSNQPDTRRRAQR